MWDGILAKFVQCLPGESAPSRSTEFAGHVRPIMLLNVMQRASNRPITVSFLKVS
jgi:hypothetical protein